MPKIKCVQCKTERSISSKGLAARESKDKNFKRKYTCRYCIGAKNKADRDARRSARRSRSKKSR